MKTVTMVAVVVAMNLASASANAGDDEWYSYAQADRLEYQEHRDTIVWDLQGWIGGDYDKLWWKTEGDAEDGNVEEAELQLLYSKALTAYFDLQAGIRYEDLNGLDQASLVVGLHGMAPYKFELDIAAFLTDDGDALLRVEGERDFALTQRWVLQPRAELEASFSDVDTRGIASGFNSLDLGLRLRYEVSRKVAPYIGVSWQRAIGGTADLVEAAGEDEDATTFVVGLRAWF